MFSRIEKWPSVSLLLLAFRIARQCNSTHVVLDGEIVCLDDRGRPQFNEMLFTRGDSAFFAFDVRSGCISKEFQEVVMADRHNGGRDGNRPQR